MKKALLFLFAVVSVALLSAFVVAPDQVRVPRAKVTKTQPPNARFSHWAHDGNRCWACHPSVFPAREPVTHKSMSKGLACGACHDGKRARAVSKMSCGGCHVR